MRAELLTKTIKSLFEFKRTLCIEGPPGIGKTAIFHQVAKELKVPLIVVHTPTMLVEDFGILFPIAGKKKVGYHLTDWYPVKGEAPDEGILLFDDRNQANTDLQKVMANICQARELHGSKLPDGWMVASTGNRQSDRAGANRILTHLRDRETVIDLEPNLKDWITWAGLNGISPEVIAFISFRPSLLHDFDPQRDQNPSPRSWAEGVSAIMYDIPEESRMDCFKGSVGDGAAAEFIGFMDICSKLPDIDKLIANPDQKKIPKEPITIYAICSALMHRVNDKNVNNICKLAAMMPVEFSVLVMLYIGRKDKDLLDSSPAFKKWAVKNGHYFH